MTASTSNHLGFSSEDPESIVKYEPLSALAIATLIVGIASPLAMVHPVLWVVPMVGCVLGGLALRQIGRPDAGIRGRALAVCGIVLAVFFGSCGITWKITRQTTLARQGRQYGEQWFELVQQGRFEEAHQMTLSYEDRLEFGSALKEAYAPKETSQEDEPPIDEDDLSDEEMAAMMRDSTALSDQLFRFLHDYPMDLLSAQYDQLDVHYAGAGAVRRLAANRWMVETYFNVSFPKDGGSETHRILLSLERLQMGDNVYWRVDTINEADRT